MLSIRLTGIELSAIVMIRAALFWKRWILLKLDLLDEDQADKSYSRTDLTLPSYNFFRTFKFIE
jgi:hypothetical protein